jgi:CheY-like chemotaxis protein
MKPLEILLIEDNIADAKIAAEALREISASSRISIVSSGEEALTYLGAQADAHMPSPDLIFMDMHLPGRMDWRSWQKSGRMPGCNISRW